MSKKALAKAKTIEERFVEWFKAWVRYERREAKAHLVESAGIALIELHRQFKKAVPQARWTHTEFKQHLWNFCRTHPSVRYNEHLAWSGNSITARRWLRGPRGRQMERVVITTTEDVRLKLVPDESARITALQNAHAARIEAYVLKLARALVAKHRKKYFVKSLKRLAGRGLKRSQVMKRAHMLDKSGMWIDEMSGVTLEDCIHVLREQLGDESVDWIVEGWYKEAYATVKSPRALSAILEKYMAADENQIATQTPERYRRKTVGSARISSEQLKKFRV